jgi:hypothetical protein
MKERLAGAIRNIVFYGIGAVAVIGSCIYLSSADYRQREKEEIARSHQSRQEVGDFEKFLDLNAPAFSLIVAGAYLIARDLPKKSNSEKK